MTNERVFRMKFSEIYKALTDKVQRKGRTKADADAVICWMTGYSADNLNEMAASEITYKEFFDKAPAMNPLRANITGKICGVDVALIEDPMMRDIRYIDKLIDEVAKGKTIEKILSKYE